MGRQWQNAVRNLVANHLPVGLEDGTMPSIVRKFLVFVNPKSGSGTAIKVWQQVVKPMLQEAQIDVTLIITEYANHAKRYVSNINNLTPDIEAIAIIGGDGLLFEVVNGIGSRSDATELFQRIYLAPIPGGTGNGLVKSILFVSDEASTARNATFCAIRGVPQALDLSKIATANGDTHFSFLSLSWGLVADIDILSESMRFLGEMRLYVAAVYFILQRRMYDGRLRMKLSNASYQSATTTASKGQNMLKTDKINRLLPTDSSDNEYVTLESRFLLVWAVQTSHASTSVYSGPGVGLDDGLFTVYAVQNISRFALAGLLLAMDNGTFINHPDVRIFKCSEYILEPLTDEGRLSLDGELIHYGRIEAKLLPSAAKVKVMTL
jgi:sphingosine kinase